MDTFNKKYGYILAVLRIEKRMYPYYNNISKSQQNNEKR